MGLKETCREQAKFAQEKLEAGKGNGGTCEARVPHDNPVTNKPCNGPIAIKFKSWDEAVKSMAMRVFGDVGGICSECGFEGRLGPDQQWVKIL